MSDFKGEFTGKMIEVDRIFVKDNGSYNEMPYPFKSITQKKALTTIMDEVLVDTDFRQIPRNVFDGSAGRFGTPYFNTKIFWFNTVGIAIVNCWSEKKFRFFRVGCEHKNTIEKDLGRSLYEVTCKDCGLIYEYDSSD